MSDVLVPVAELQEGDLVDLEGDEFYDHDEALCSCRTIVQYEYATVVELVQETPTCTAVYFEGIAGCGFPPDHQLKVHRP